MKKILLNKRKYGLKDVLRIVALSFAHYIFFYIYFITLFLVHYFTNGQFFPEVDGWYSIILYSCFIAPGVNVIIHAFYAEKGSPWMRALMWFHTLCVVLILPIAIFS